MLGELYHFDWNTTNNQIQHQQKSDVEELERMWCKSDQIFSTWGNIVTAVLCTYQLIRAIILGELFLILRQLVKIASKLILVWIVPGLANKLSTWGEENRNPWSFALIHEDLMTR